MDPNQQLIERYFENNLSSDELAAFQKRLSNDPGFAKAFQLEKELMEGIEAFGNEQLRQQLETIHMEEAQGPFDDIENDAEPPIYVSPFDPQPENGKVVKIVGRRWWLAAAVLILGLVARWAFTDKTATPQQLYAIYAVHDFNFTQMSTNEELLPKAEGLLKTNQYEPALSLLDTYLQANPNATNIQIVKGIALLELGKYDPALEMFRNVQAGNTAMAGTALWYEALVYLKKGDIDECTKTLSSIPVNSSYYKDAEELLAYLK